jgi:hypothetical protein
MPADFIKNKTEIELTGVDLRYTLTFESSSSSPHPYTEFLRISLDIYAALC